MVYFRTERKLFFLVISTILFIATTVLLFVHQHDENVIKGLACFVKKPADWGRMINDVYKNDNYYATRTPGNANVMLTDALGKMYCPGSELLQGQADPWAPSDVCGCIHRQHTNKFLPMYLNLNMEHGQVQDQAERDVTGCIFQYRLTSTITLTEDLKIFPHSVILYIAFVGHVCSLCSWLLQWKREKKLGTEKGSYMDLGSLAWPVLGLGPAIALGVSLYHKESARQGSLEFIPAVLVLALAWMMNMRGSEDDAAGKEGVVVVMNKIQRELPWVEYCFTLPLLVLLFDATQQHRDLHYLLSRMFFSIGLSLMVGTWRYYHYVRHIGKVVQTVNEDYSMNIQRVWFVATLFLVGNTPPGRWSPEVWTQAFVPSAFYIYILGMPLVAVGEQKNMMMVGGVTAEGSKDATTMKRGMAMWEDLISILSRTLLVMALVSANRASSLHVQTPVQL